MFGNNYVLVSALSALVILSYFFSYISERIRVPSVLLLIITGIITQLLFSYYDIQIPGLRSSVEIFGIIGLILIVLEGTLELRLTRDKLDVMKSAFYSALMLLLTTSVLMAIGILIINPGLTFRVCFVNAIPLSVVSSAIAIPSVMVFSEEKKEFLIYESIFSDILGIIIFNAVVEHSKLSWMVGGFLIVEFTILVVLSIGLTFVLLYLMDKIKLKIKFFLLLSVLVLLFNLGKLMHISSLIIVLVFGLILNNLDLLWKDRMSRFMNIHNLSGGVVHFRMIINESAFLIRTLFFFVFGLSFNFNSLASINVLITGVVILVILYGLRFFYLKYGAKLKEMSGPLLIAPRGLITIILYYSIPPELNLGFISEGVLFFVIIISSLVMMIGLRRAKIIKDDFHELTYEVEDEPELEEFFGKRKEE